MSVGDWSTTAGSNQTADANINWQEGQLPSTVNNSARAMMAALKDFFQNQGGFAVLGGTGDTFSLTFSQPITTRQPLLLGFFATRTNTGAVTLQIDSTPAAPLRAVTAVDLVAGQIISGAFYVVSYNSATTEYIISGAFALGLSDLPTMADGTVLTNISGASAKPTASTLAAFFAKTPDNAITKQMMAKMAVGSVMGNNDGTAATISGTATVSSGSPGVITWPTTAPADGTPFYMTTTGALLTGLTANRFYYCKSPVTTSSNFAATPGGAAINTSGSQSGVHTIIAPAQAQAGLMSYAELSSALATQMNPLIAKPPFAQNLVIKNNSGTPNTKVDVTAGLVFLSASTVSKFFSSVSVTINAATTGANGLDTGSLTTNQEYHVYLISDGANVAGLLSLSATSPTMPTGYTMAQRFGCFKTDGSSNFYRIIQNGNRAQYQVTAATNTASMWMINNANTGNVATPTYTAFQVTGAGKAAPSTATAVTVVVATVAGAAGSTLVAPNANYGSSTSATNPPPLGVTSIAAVVSKTIVLESNSIYVASSNSTLGSVMISDWIDSVPAV